MEKFSQVLLSPQEESFCYLLKKESLLKQNNVLRSQRGYEINRERGLQCAHGGRNPGTFHSVRLSLGKKRGVDLSEKTSNFVSKLFPCRDSDCPRVAGGPERRKADQPSKSNYLLQPSVHLGRQRLSSTIVPTVRKSHPGWAGG